MEQHPAVREDGIVRKDGSVTPANAGDVIAAVVDITKMHGLVIAPRFKGIIARESKALLEAGFDWMLVVRAGVVSIRRGEPHRIQWIAQDLANVEAGQYLRCDEYRQQLEDEAEIRRWQEQRWGQRAIEGGDDDRA